MTREVRAGSLQEHTHTQTGTIFRLFRWALGRGTGPKGDKKAGGFTGTDSQDLATILDPFRTIFVDLGPGRLSET